MRQNKTFGSIDQLELILGSDGPVTGFQGLVDATTVSNLAADSVTPTELNEAGDYTTNSLNTGASFTKSRAYEYIIREDSGGTVHVDGPTGEVASGTAASAIKTAVETNPSGSYWVNGDISVSSTIDINLGGATGLTFHMGGCFQPDSSLTHVMRVVDGERINIKFAVGAGAGADYSYAQDFAANVSGLDTALYLRGTKNCELQFQGDGWAGRGLEIEDEQTGEAASAEFTIESFKAQGLGQSMHVNVSSGFGSVDNVFVTETDGAYFNASDLGIKFYENLYLGGSTPITIENSNPTNIGHLAVGPNVDPLVHIKNSERVKLGHVYAYGQGNAVDGVHITGCDEVYGYIQTYNCKGAYGLVLDGVQEGSSLTHISKIDTGSVHLTTDAAPTRELDLYEYSLKPDERAVNFTAGPNGGVSRTRIGGVLREANWSQTAGESTVHADSVGHGVTFDGVLMEGTYPEYHIDAPAGTNIRVLNSDTRGAPSGAAKFSNFPREVVNDREFRTIDQGTENNAVPVGSGDSTGLVDVTVAPSIDRPLDPKFVDVWLSNPTTNDYDAHIRDVQSFGGDGDFTAKVQVDAISASTGDTVDLSWRVDASRR